MDQALKGRHLRRRTEKVFGVLGYKAAPWNVGERGGTCCFRFLSKRAGGVETCLALASGWIKKKREKLHTGGLSQRGGRVQVSGLGGEGAGCERLWRSLQEKAGLVLTLEKAVPRPGMGEGGAPDR